MHFLFFPWWKLFWVLTLLLFQSCYCQGNAPLNFALRFDIRNSKAILWPDFLSRATFSQISVRRPRALMEELGYFVIIRCELMHNGLFCHLKPREA